MNVPANNRLPIGIVLLSCVIPAVDFPSAILIAAESAPQVKNVVPKAEKKPQELKVTTSQPAIFVLANGRSFRATLRSLNSKYISFTVGRLTTKQFVSSRKVRAIFVAGRQLVFDHKAKTFRVIETPASLADTVWMGLSNARSKLKPISFQFSASGRVIMYRADNTTVLNEGLEGKYTYVKNQLLMIFQDGKTRYRGEIIGSTMMGRGRDSSANWPWALERALTKPDAALLAWQNNFVQLARANEAADARREQQRKAAIARYKKGLVFAAVALVAVGKVLGSLDSGGAITGGGGGFSSADSNSSSRPTSGTPRKPTEKPRPAPASGYPITISISYPDGGRYAVKSFDYRYGIGGSYVRATTDSRGQVVLNLRNSGYTHMYFIIANGRYSTRLRYSGGRYQPVSIRLK